MALSGKVEQKLVHLTVAAIEGRPTVRLGDRFLMPWR
ncbi:hypothetical protein FHT92_004893 [Rhizobium sp. BK377]|nr:hypothetical protein [Rhizobium sp. BK377]